MRCWCTATPRWSPSTPPGRWTRACARSCVTRGTSTRPTAPVEDTGARAGILVSAGSSAAGLDLCRAAADAARLRPELGWRILAGHGIADSEFDALSAGLADGVLSRARPDYRALLARAAVSVSACGYNTAVDLLATRSPAVLVPFAAGGETEQTLRAEHLAARGLARIVPENVLTPTTLVDAVEAVRAEPAPAAPRDRPRRSRHARSRSWRRCSRSGAGACARERHRSIAFAPSSTTPAPAASTCRSGGATTMPWPRRRPWTACSTSRRPWTPLFSSRPSRRASCRRSAARLDDAPRVSLAVHGLAHANHAAAGGKPSEFGTDRPLAVTTADAAEGLRLARERLQATALLPVFVPPWNRLAPDLAAALPDLGYLGLSSVRGSAVPGLIRADVAFDPIDWRGTRSLADPVRLIETLCRTIAQDHDRPIGLLTHHLAHDAAIWDFLDALLAVLFRHPAVTIRDPRHLFRPPAVDEAVPACWTRAADEPARIA